MPKKRKSAGAAARTGGGLVGRNKSGVSKKKIKKKGKEEIDLENLLFPNDDNDHDHHHEDDDDHADYDNTPDNTDNNPKKKKNKKDDNDDVGADSEDDDKDDRHNDKKGGGKLVSAWHDPHDEQIKVDVSGSSSRLRKLRKTEGEKVISGADYSQRLKDKFRDIAASSHAAASSQHHAVDTSWASLGGAKDDDAKGAGSGVESLLQTTSSLIEGGHRHHNQYQSTSSSLPSKEIKVSRLMDANANGVNNSTVTSARFHPSGEVLMTSGMDKCIRLFQPDGVRNTMMSCVVLDGFPIYTAEFTARGDEVVCTSRRHHFYTMNVETCQVTRVPGIKSRKEKSFEKFAMQHGPHAKYMAMVGTSGNLLILSQTNKQFLFNVKANADVVKCGFAETNEHHLYSICRSGEVYLWDMRMRKCVSRHYDFGSVHGTCIAATFDSKMYACGSSSGVVNLYSNLYGKEQQQQQSKGGAFRAAATAPKPVKSFMNLTTPIDHLAFTRNSEILAMSSSREKDSFRLVHVNSRTVFANWPTNQTPLNYVSTLDFSPNGGFLAIGNAKGRVLLYRLNHYSTA